MLIQLQVDDVVVGRTLWQRTRGRRGSTGTKGSVGRQESKAEDGIAPYRQLIMNIIEMKNFGQAIHGMNL